MDYHIRQEHLKPGDLKGPDRIYCGLEDAETGIPGARRLKNVPRGHDLQAVKLHGGTIQELVGVLTWVATWLYVEVLGLHPV